MTAVMRSFTTTDSSVKVKTSCAIPSSKTAEDRILEEYQKAWQARLDELKASLRKLQGSSGK